MDSRVAAVSSLEASMTKQGTLTEKKLEDMNSRIVAEIDEAVALADKDPYPDPEDCLRDVYYEE